MSSWSSNVVRAITEESIKALGEITLDSKDALENAEALYKELGKELKELVDEELVNKLTSAREEYNALVETSKPIEEDLVASFELGENKVGGTESSSAKTEYVETNSNYTLTLTNATRMYPNSYDATGRSVIKLGGSNEVGSFEFTVPNDVTKVIILVSGRGSKTTEISVNGTNYIISTVSDSGDYTAVEIDTTTTKTISFTGVKPQSGDYRCMINTIKFLCEESQTPVDPNPDQPEPDQPEVEEPATSKDGNISIASTENDYYADLRGKWGQELAYALTTLLKETHSNELTYDYLKEGFAYTDLGPTGKIMTVYAHAEFLTSWDDAIDREHVWPKSKSWFKDDSGMSRTAASDLHHIRPSLDSINQHAKGDRAFGELDESSREAAYSNGYLGGYVGKVNDVSYFEPLDHSKGDIARIIMYVITRYSEEYTTFVQNGGNDITGVIQDPSLLLKWNKLDPVDDYEMQRNNRTAELQGNRNPFIDHPEFADMAFGQYTGEGALIDNEGGNVLMNDEALVERATKAIDDIGTVTEANLETENKILKAENLYKNLSSELQTQISSQKEKLDAARKEYDRLYEEWLENQKPNDAENVIRFEFGENGTADHYDGNSTEIKAPYVFEEGNNSITFSSVSKVYVGGRDAKGNSCIKLGSSSTAGTFTFTVDNDVNKVTIFVSGRNSKDVNISINGEETILITTHSDNGEYTPIEIDTTTNKTVTLLTSKPSNGDIRCMINSILLEKGEGSTVEPENPGQGGGDVVEPENPGQGGGEVVEPENPGENEEPKDPVISTSSSSLTSENLGLKNSYADSTVTIDGVSLQLTQCADYGDGIQMRYKNSIKSSIANTTAFESGIASLKLVWSTTKSNGFANEKMMMIEFSNSADFSNAEVQYVNTVIGETEYVITPSVSTYNYVRITNNLSYSSYWSAIEVNFASEE